MARLQSVCILGLAASLASAWSVNDAPTSSRRSVLRDAATTMGATIAGASTAGLPPAGAAAEMLAPAPPPDASSGVLWKTTHGQALPATPSQLANVMKDEVMGFYHPPSSSPPPSGIVCISERHDDFEHHKVQLKILMTMRKVLAERNQDPSDKLTIGMEMFQRRHQKYLDKYVASAPGYTLDDLRRDTEWDITWGYDLLHYLPLLLFARKNQVRVLGLHPSDEEVEAVRQHGLGAVSLTGVSTTDPNHAEEFRRAVGRQLPPFSARSDDSESSNGRGPEAAEMDACIARQYEVQCFREEYMAEAAAVHHAASAPDGGWMAVLAGERHVIRRHGLPFRVLRRSANVRKSLSAMSQLTSSPRQGQQQQLSRGVFTIVPQTVSFPVATKDALGMEAADYVWYVQRDPTDKFREDAVNSAPLRSLAR